MDAQKIKSLSEHILAECEKRDFTLTEVRFLGSQLKIDIAEAIHGQDDIKKFTRPK